MVVKELLIIVLLSLSFPLEIGLGIFWIQLCHYLLHLLLLNIYLLRHNLPFVILCSLDFDFWGFRDVKRQSEGMSCRFITIRWRNMNKTNKHICHLTIASSLVPLRFAARQSGDGIYYDYSQLLCNKWGVSLLYPMNVLFWKDIL